MAIQLQGTTPYLQGNTGTSLQGSLGGALQGSGTNLQGQTPVAAKPTPKPTAYGSPGATSPAKAAYINDLSSKYGNSGGTIYDKATGQGFSDPNAFYKAAGVNSFDGLKFDTSYTSGGQPTAQPAAPATLAQVNSTITPTAETDPMAPFKSAYQSYIQSLAPSAEVNDAHKKYSDFIASRDSGLQAINDKVIPMNFITGQKASLNNQAEITANRLQDDITNANANQTSLQNAAKAKSDFESSLLTDKNTKAATAQKFAYDNNITTPFYNVGGTIYRTSDGKAFSSQAEAFGAGVARDYSNAPQVQKPQDPITVGEGGAIYDPVTNSFIAKNPKTSEPQAANNVGGLNLTNQQLDNINPIANAFRSEQIVQNFNTIAEGYNFVNSFNPNSKNPANDQALVYALAKALDPGSVVREGEYATVQKYAQSLAQSYGKSITQAISGSGFLSADARNNIISTIKSRYDTSKQNYDNVYSEYARRIGTVAGIPDGSAFLTNYAGGYSSAGGGGNTNDPLGLGFKSVGNTSGSTPYLKTLGAITAENGSEIWAPGLDIDLKIGDPVRTPVSGIVIAAKPNGGFGNQVKIRDAAGNEYWLSHLDSGSVKVGQTVSKGQVIGKGGNTGNTIGINGGDGSHLDFTIKGSNGKLLTAAQVKEVLSRQYV